jgi:hypothetical protein
MPAKLVLIAELGLVDAHGFEGPQTCPILECDVCYQRITDAKGANVRWKQGDLGSYQIVHKGCDSVKDRDAFPMSMSAAQFLADLAYNCGIR